MYFCWVSRISRIAFASAIPRSVSFFLASTAYSSPRVCRCESNCSMSFGADAWSCLRIWSLMERPVPEIKASSSKLRVLVSDSRA